MRTFRNRLTTMRLQARSHAGAQQAVATPRKRVTGVIDSWHFVDRVGYIKLPEDESGSCKVVKIQSTASFESLMPTMYRDLKGTQASFILSNDGAFAENIILHAHTVPQPRFDETSVPPVYGRQDLRQESLRIKAFEDERKEERERIARYLNERKSGSLSVQGSSARVVCPETMTGIITHWSPIHRTGVIEVLRNGSAIRYVIQRAQDFLDAMPSSLALVRAVVEFRPVHTHVVENPAQVHEALSRGASIEGIVTLGACTHMIAEDIVVKEFPKTATKEEKAQDLSLSAITSEREYLLDGPGPHFGIITRWSGGQGILEAGNGKSYYLENANAFLTFDPGQSAIRGAVAQFQQDPAKPRYAHSVVILTELGSKSGGVGELNITPTTLPLSAIDTEDFDQSISNVTATDPSEATGKTEHRDNPYAHLPQLQGRLVNFSKSEKNGIIEELTADGKPTGKRFVMRDATRDVNDFSSPAVEASLEKGCTVTFVAVGASGKVARNVVVLSNKKGESTEEVAKQQELQAETETTSAGAAGETGDLKPTEEAIASPTAVGYWLQRFERVGANMSEYRKATESLTPPQMEDDNDFADDPWFKDPKRNKTVRGNATVSDMMKVQPAGLMHLSMKTQDPAKLAKEVKKYEKRIPDDVRNKCLEEAKTLAPRFLKSMQDAKARSGEMTFNFFK